MADDYLTNGVPWSDYVTIQDFGEGEGAPEMRGEDYPVPGRGEVATLWVPGPRRLQPKLLLLGSSATQVRPVDARERFHERGDAFRALLFNRGRPFTLTRRRELTTGTQDVDALCRYLGGLEPQQVAHYAGRVAPDLKLLEGVFYAQAPATVNPGTVTVPGQADTRRMTITLPGAGTLANTTLGVSVTVTTACTLTVQGDDPDDDFAATAGLATLTHAGDDFWFVLAPGANTITWSAAGSPSIAYKAAYL